MTIFRLKLPKMTIFAKFDDFVQIYKLGEFSHDFAQKKYLFMPKDVPFLLPFACLRLL